MISQIRDASYSNAGDSPWQAVVVRSTHVFDLCDDWTHLCTVVDASIDPSDAIGMVPNVPLPYFGWGIIPDQYGRSWSGEDGESPTPLDPGLTDLPPLRPGWGTRSKLL